MSSENINNANHRRKPKKLIHCSDGVVEESSDDEVDQAPEIRNTDSSVNAKDLHWAPYFKYKTVKAGHKILNGVDVAGGALANFFGITTPKYSSEIYFHEKDKEQEQRRRQKDNMESANWLPTNNNEVVVDDIVASVKNERF